MLVNMEEEAREVMKGIICIETTDLTKKVKYNSLKSLLIEIKVLIN